MDRDLQVVGEDGDDIKKLLDEHSPFLIGGFGPDLVQVQLSEDG